VEAKIDFLLWVKWILEAKINCGIERDEVKLFPLFIL
jgi:hypothetical protein